MWKGIKGWGMRKGNRRGAYDQSVVEILTDDKQATLREEENSQILFIPADPDVFTHLIWVLSKGFTGYLKGSAGHQVTRNELGLIGEGVVS
jgi:hypothetical protein